MAHPMTLPTLAGLAILAVAAGVQLGLGAAAQMEAARPEPAPTRSYARFTPHRGFDGAQSGVYDRWDEPAPMEIGMADLGPCRGCRDFAFSDPVESVGDMDPAVQEDIVDDDQAVPGLPPVPAVDDIERYARYPVSSEEALESPDADASGTAVGW